MTYDALGRGPSTTCRAGMARPSCYFGDLGGP
jgi:hypothetical protein